MHVCVCGRAHTHIHTHTHTHTPLTPIGTVFLLFYCAVTLNTISSVFCAVRLLSFFATETHKHYGFLPLCVIYVVRTGFMVQIDSFFY